LKVTSYIPSTFKLIKGEGGSRKYYSKHIYISQQVMIWNFCVNPQFYPDKTKIVGKNTEKFLRMFKQVD
jgi:hypothetical protein